MKWSLIDLKTRLAKVNEALICEKNEERRLELKLDAITLDSLILYVSGQKEYDSQGRIACFKKLGIYDMFNPAFSYMQNHQKDLSKAVLSLYTLKVPTVFAFNWKISDKEYFDLVNDFIKNFDKNMYDFYNVMLKKRLIELNPDKFMDVSARGITHPVCSEGISYINSRFDNTTKNLITLPHEIGHAFQFGEEKNLKKSYAKVMSVFREAYPIFIELAFCDYLKNTKYAKYAYMHEGLKIDELSSTLEFEGLNFINIENGFYKDCMVSFKDGSSCSENVYRFLYSDLLAFYFITAYRKHPDYAKKQIDEFNKNIGNVKDDELLRYYPVDTLISATKEYAESYVKAYKRK